MVDKQKILHDWLQEKSIENGLIEVYKPYGVPSTALTELYKRVTGLKVGHGGTLDPLAEGSMLLGIGAGTKLLTKYLTSQKRYRAMMLFGAQSFSGDLELPIEVPPINDLKEIGEDNVRKILTELSSEYMQTLPVLSAAKHQGKTAYKLSRSGKAVEERSIVTKLLEHKIISFTQLSVPECQNLFETTGQKLRQEFSKFVEIGLQVGYTAQKYSFMIEKWNKSFEDSKKTLNAAPVRIFFVLELEVLVPKGMYIRSLVTDIAGRMGTVGMLLKLVRIRYS